VAAVHKVFRLLCGLLIVIRDNEEGRLRYVIIPETVCPIGSHIRDPTESAYLVLMFLISEISQAGHSNVSRS